MGKNNYKILKTLGQGSFGSVFLAQNLNSQSHSDYVAIKRFYMYDKKSFESFKNEIKIIKKIKSDYLVKVFDYYKDSQYMYMVMEYAPKGDLEGYIRSFYKNNKKIDLKFIDTMIYQITEGINILHKNNIIHRDIKLPNILVFKDNLVKITDFGVSKLLEKENMLANTAIGTPYYMSPEIIKGNPYNFSVDFWALGCLIYKSLTNKYPFESNSITGLCRKIINGKYDLSIIPFKYKKIIKKLLEIDKNRVDEKDVFKFILSNSNTFINKEKILDPVKKKIYELTKNYNISDKKLEPIKNNHKPVLKEINEISKKLEPLNKNYLKKLNEIDSKFPEFKNNNKLEPIKDYKIRYKKDKRYNKISDYDNNRYPNYNHKKLEPIKDYKERYKKDFVKFNINNIKNIEKRSRFSKL